MKKNINYLILTIILVSLSACSSNVVNNNSTVASSGQNAFKRPDFGQPEESPTFMGIVKSIVGNEVTILKIERPERSGQKDVANTKATEGEINAPAIGVTGGTTRIPGAGGRMGGGFGGGGDSDQQAQMIEAMKSRSNGEATIMIPVGSQMLKKDDTGTDSVEMIEASLADIKKDTMIQVWLDKEITDRNISTFIIIMQ